MEMHHSPLGVLVIFKMVSFRWQKKGREKKNRCNMTTTEVDMWWVLHATGTLFQHELWIRAFAKQSLFMCVFIRNLWEIQRLLAEPGDQDRNNSQTTTAARLSKGEKGSAYIYSLECSPHLRIILFFFFFLLHVFSSWDWLSFPSAF